MCPSTMKLIPGGLFWVGSHQGRSAEEEHPRFQIRIQAFCLDETEVTASKYDACVSTEKCTASRSKRITCTSGKENRADHPMNCIDWHQAKAYCEVHGARLPSEVEWEYAASGGSDTQRYSWGNETPEGRTCWKLHRTCPVGSFAAGDFGLRDMTGNVWEWTADAFGPYPWLASASKTRVYRGGSWSRRFDKWMHNRLRNRFGADRHGSHLGFRCALSDPKQACASALEGGGCARDVIAMECPGGKSFNGVRCAPEGAGPCPAGTTEKRGYGCVRTAAGGTSSKDDSLQPEIAEVRVLRSPNFDSDCREYQKSRPTAYRLEGGSHRARNAVGRDRSCKNRDVGVGWNSACCP